MKACTVVSTVRVCVWAAAFADTEERPVFLLLTSFGNEMRDLSVKQVTEQNGVYQVRK